MFNKKDDRKLHFWGNLIITLFIGPFAFFYTLLLKVVNKSQKDINAALRGYTIGFVCWIFLAALIWSIIYFKVWAK